MILKIHVTHSVWDSVSLFHFLVTLFQIILLLLAKRRRKKMTLIKDLVCVLIKNFENECIILYVP